MHRVLAACGVAALTGTALAGPSFEPGLYGIQSSNSDETWIMRINPDTGEATQFAMLSHNTSLVGATFLRGELYASDVLSFDPVGFYGTFDASGQFTPIHDQGFDLNWHGLASSESLGVTWSISQQNNNMLVQTDLNGVMTSIGPTGIDGRGMAYDDANGILYAINYSDASLYTVNTQTGESTRIGATGIPSDMIGLAFDESTGTLYLNEGLKTNSLYRVDVETGAATLIGANGFGDIDGLAWIPSPSSATLLGFGAIVGSRRRRSR
jgi:DNA-binding beta-propeller fold protein YncE